VRFGLKKTLSLAGSGARKVFAVGKIFSGRKGKIRLAAVIGIGLIVAAVESQNISVSGISFYQKFISPHKGYHCAYAYLHHGVTCSEFGKEAIAKFGVIEGIKLLNERFGECSASAAYIKAAHYHNNNDCGCSQAAGGCFANESGGFIKGCCSATSGK
jgi:putative component of membrane protein insertase Oxa1/YidC/SpoIIIJ protein YidD